MTRPPRMKRYRLTSTITISVTTVVRARSPKAAKEAGLDTPVMTLCHQCASGDETTEWVTSGELDGSPEDLSVEEEGS